jgi:hypothetical protein
MVEIIFKGSKIQTGFRVKIPKPIIDTLNLMENQPIIIKYNPDTKELLIQEDKKEEKKVKK